MFCCIFLKGSLPWQGMKVDKHEDRYKKIYEKKKSTSAEELTKDLPSEFTTFVNYTRDMEFEADPNYDYLRGLLKSVLERHCSKDTGCFDWEVVSNSSNSNVSTLGDTVEKAGLDRVVTLSSVPRFFDEPQKPKEKVVVSESKGDCVIM